MITGDYKLDYKLPGQMVIKLNYITKKTLAPPGSPHFENNCVGDLKEIHLKKPSKYQDWALNQTLDTPL